MFEKIARRPANSIFWIAVFSAAVCLFLMGVLPKMLPKNGNRQILESALLLSSALLFNVPFLLINSIFFWIFERLGWPVREKWTRRQIAFSLISIAFFVAAAFSKPFFGRDGETFLVASAWLLFIGSQLIFLLNLLTRKMPDEAGFLTRRPEKTIFLLASLAFLPLILFVAAAFFKAKIEVEDFGGTIFCFTFFGAFLLLAARGYQKTRGQKLDQDGIRAHFWLTVLGMFLFVFAETVVAPFERRNHLFTISMMAAGLVFFIFGQVVFVRNLKKAAVDATEKDELTD